MRHFERMGTCLYKSNTSSSKQDTRTPECQTPRSKNGLQTSPSKPIETLQKSQTWKNDRHYSTLPTACIPRQIFMVHLAECSLFKRKMPPHRLSRCLACHRLDAILHGGSGRLQPSRAQHAAMRYVSSLVNHVSLCRGPSLPSTGFVEYYPESSMDAHCRRPEA
jgi:hypothetical protein